MLNIRGVLEVEGFSDEVVGDPGAHMHALSYIEGLAVSETGYQVCMDLLTDGTSCDDRVKFHLLASIKEYVNERYADENADGRERMRRFLSRYVAVQRESKRYDTAVVRLAAAQIHVIVFEFDYVLHWNDYFDDIVRSAYAGIKTVDHTLRIVDLTSLWLKSSDEVEDKMPDEFREIQLAREFLQINDLPRVITFLCNVITEYEPLEIIALKVIHDLLTWIDVHYFEDLRIVDVLTARLYTLEAWEVAVDCFVLMTRRITHPARKQTMLTNVFDVMAARLTHVTHAAYHAKIGQLHDAMGVSLVVSHDEAMKCWQYGLSAVFRDMVSALFDKVQPYLAHADYATSMSVANFTLRYVKLMEKYSCVHKEHVSALYAICVAKLRVAVDDADDADDADGYRGALAEVFKSLTRVDKQAAFETIQRLQTTALADGDGEGDADVDAVELSLYLLQLFGEARNEIAPRQITCDTDALIAQLTAPLLSSNLWLDRRPRVATRFFQTVSACAATADAATLQRVLELLLSEHGIGHRHAGVRGHCARYLRDVVAALPPEMCVTNCQCHVETVCRLAGVGTGGGAGGGGGPHDEHARLDLHETLAHFVTRGDLTHDERRALHAAILDAAHGRLRDIAFQWKSTPAKHRDELASGVSFAADLVSRSTRAFAAPDDLPLVAGAAANYLAAFDAFLRLPTPILARRDVHTSLRRLVKRLVCTLADAFLPAVADVIQTLCTTSTMTLVAEDTDLLVYLIDAYAGKLVPTLRREFSYIGESIYLPTALALSKGHGMSDGPLREEFERSYLAYMRAIVRNRLFDQLFRQGQKAHIFGVIYILSSGCYPSLLPHETFETFASYLQMEPHDMLVYLDMVTEEVKALFLSEFEMHC